MGVTSYDITTANIENGCKVIYGAFDTCRSLTSITIGNGVTSIGEQAFYDCTSLSDIYCKATSEPIGWDGRWKDRCSATVHWGNEWEYVDGVPTLKQN